MLTAMTTTIQPFATRFPRDGVSGGGGRNDARTRRGSGGSGAHRRCSPSAVRQRHDSAGHPVPNGRECQRPDRAHAGSGYDTPDRPAVLLLHGFPELAYSWRKVMLPLASAGYHVIAPDQRGYGRTTGWDDSYDADPDPFRMLNMVRDAIGLVYALGHRSVAMVVGHDAGAPVASWAALVRPDIFRSVVDHELALRRPAAASVQHREWRRAAALRRPPTMSSTRSSRSSTRRGSTTRTISARAGPTTTCSMRRKAFTHSSAPITTTRAPTGKENKPHPLKARIADGDGADPDLLRDGEGQGHGGDGRAVHAVGRRDRGVQVADRGRGRRLCDRVRPNAVHRRPSGLSRAARLRSEESRRDADVLGPLHRRPLDVRRREERLGHLSDSRARSTGCGRARARAWSGSTSWTAPATGCSRSSPNR